MRFSLNHLGTCIEFRFRLQSVMISDKIFPFLGLVQYKWQPKTAFIRLQSMNYLLRLVEQLCSSSSPHSDSETISHQSKRLIRSPSQDGLSIGSHAPDDNQKLTSQIKQYFQQSEGSNRPAAVSIPRQEGKKILLLDLDKTLIFYLPSTGLRIRPHLSWFLQQVAHHYVVCVFTAATRSYLDQILALLAGEGVPVHLFDFFIARQSCLKFKLPSRRTIYVKDITLIANWRPQEIVVFDDTPTSYCLNPQNAVPISSFEGNPADDSLLHAAEVLEEIQHIEDVRKYIQSKYMPEYQETAGAESEKTPTVVAYLENNPTNTYGIADKSRKTW